MRRKAWLSQVIGIFVSMIGLWGCSSTDTYQDQPLEVIYKSAESLMSREQYEKAADRFDEVERQYPYDAKAAIAQLMSAFCAFKAQKFERAISTLDVFISLHPASPFIQYAYYLRALCYYTDIFPVLRDKENAELALHAFDEVIKRFPETDYAQDAQFKIDFIKEHIACQEISIAKHYLKGKKYVAALDRLSVLVRDYPKSILIPEALYRIVECQIALGLCESAHKTAAMLSYNFPEEMWTGMAKDLLCRYTGSQPKIISVTSTPFQKSAPGDPKKSSPDAINKTEPTPMKLEKPEDLPKAQPLPPSNILEHPPIGR